MKGSSYFPKFKPFLWNVCGMHCIQCNVCGLQELKKTKGSFESQKVRYPLILEELRIEVKFLMAKGQRKIQEQKLKSAVEL